MTFYADFVVIYSGKNVLSDMNQPPEDKMADIELAF